MSMNEDMSNSISVANIDIEEYTSKLATIQGFKVAPELRLDV